MISRSFYSYGEPVGPARYSCGMKEPKYNYGVDYCCFSLATGEKHCKTYYEDELSNGDKVYDGVETEIICSSEEDTEATTEITMTAKTTGSSEITTSSETTTDSALLQSIFIVGLLILIST